MRAIRSVNLPPMPSFRAIYRRSTVGRQIRFFFAFFVPWTPCGHAPVTVLGVQWFLERIFRRYTRPSCPVGPHSNKADGIAEANRSGPSLFESVDGGQPIESRMQINGIAVS